MEAKVTPIKSKTQTIAEKTAYLIQQPKKARWSLKSNLIEECLLRPGMHTPSWRVRHGHFFGVIFFELGGLFQQSVLSLNALGFLLSLQAAFFAVVLIFNSQLMLTLSPIFPRLLQALWTLKSFSVYQKLFRLPGYIDLPHSSGRNFRHTSYSFFLM